MLTHRAALVALVVVACSATEAAAANYALFAVRKVAPNQVLVHVAQPLPPLASLTCASPASCPWSVEMIDSKLSRQLIGVTAAAEPSGQSFAQFQLIVLTLAKELEPEAIRVSVTLLLNNAPTQTLKTMEAEARSRFTPVDSSDDATVYVSGIMAPAVSKHTAYTIDARAKYWFWERGLSSAFVTGEYKADARTNADPDSTSLFLTFDRYSSLIMKWDAIGIESNRKASVVNMMSRPRVGSALSHAFLATRSDASGNELSVVKASIGLDLWFGIETGLNLKHDDGIKADDFILRFVPETKAYLVVPTTGLINKIVFSAGYAVRLPVTDETFVETRDLAAGASAVPSATQRARHLAKLGITFKLTDWFGVEGQYSYGSLPPAFQIVNHSGKIGIVFQAKQIRR